MTIYSISESQFIDRELKRCIQDSGRAQNLVVTCNFPLVPPSFGCGCDSAMCRCCHGRGVTRCYGTGAPPSAAELGLRWGEERRRGDTRDHGASGAQVCGKMSSVAARRAATSSHQHRSVSAAFVVLPRQQQCHIPPLSQLTPGYMLQLYLFPTHHTNTF